jgi:hypothetical protein
MSISAFSGSVEPIELITFFTVPRNLLLFFLLMRGLLRLCVALTIEFNKLSRKLLDPKVPFPVCQRFINRHPNKRGSPLRAGLLLAKEIYLLLKASLPASLRLR